MKSYEMAKINEQFSLSIYQKQRPSKFIDA